ncbi:MAG: heavy metal translocating P-type ATPase [Clostridia bacterium]|nr:heavy metal translocating P-type ATPase [Clostridia bacterium]
MKTQKFKVTGMTCSACSAHVYKAVSILPGVTEVQVNLLTNSMNVVCEDNVSDSSICDAVVKAGYGIEADNKSSSKINKTDDIEDLHTKAMVKKLIVSVIILVPLMYISMGHSMWGWRMPAFFTANPVATALCQMILSSIVMIINQHFFINGAKNLMRGAPNMDTLVAMGSSASYIYSVAVLFRMTASTTNAHQLLHGLYFESAAMILVLITVGKTLEARSKGKTTNAIKELMDLTPKKAHVIRQGQEQIIPIDDMRVGDIFIVRPGKNIPADGEVTEGSSTTDESTLTGESLPVEKKAGSFVYAGTTNLHGFITCKATKVQGDTTLGRIIEMVENTASSKAPIAKVADKVSGIFVPAVVTIAVITCIIWMILGKNFGFALARAISVLVISCPCALGLATPVAIMVGSGVGARNGILFKTATALEQTGKTKIVVLDKTGTVTKGKPSVTDIYSAENVTKEQLLAIAAALESKSEHPLAAAIEKEASNRNINISVTVDNFEALPGYGVRGEINGTEVCGTNCSYMSEKGYMTDSLQAIGAEYAKQGMTPLFFSQAGKIIGIIAVADVIKESSAEAVSELKKMGIRVVMLTGDNYNTAQAIAKQAGIDEVISDVLPGEKEAAVVKLKQSGRLAMVGDGVNDAPALTAADVGIAIGAGSDIAIDSSSVVLMKSDLTDVAAAIKLSRKTLRNIHQNLFWAFIYNCIGIPLAAGAFVFFGLTLNPMFGAAAMSLSSICVVLNALRLNFVKIYAINKKENGKMNKTLVIDGMMCVKCQAHVEKALLEIEGVTKVTVDLKKKKAVVELASDVADDMLMKAVSDAGYTPRSCK